ncbi:F0F1-type ATP synthase, delta subunit [Buchnera aphidicola (Nipponaphis monzeni)]|uniref:ATP synthase subunit delta n=1 Tax=Buchnera aphidicola (Nipponaphis monzeni) TaxID=2495405 RepID=A0A455T9M3_9GAMM|nr:F0F1 ATP synthase subunit delta [Buchnera aphidicola]BBI01023.1 F0F1-type ATP synthase, delta subunit [Buchnera aphidicola (Nipponaphis monzeni)]
MIKLTTIARPYAKAAFEFSHEQQSIKEWENMLSIVTYIAHIKDIKVIVAGILGRKISTEIFLQLCKEYINDHFMNFIKILSNNKRLYVIKYVYLQFMEYQRNFKEITNINIISSKKINKEHLNKIKFTIQNKLTKKIYLNNTIDDSIISGKIFKSGNNVINNSICNHLKNLKKFLKK